MIETLLAAPVYVVGFLTTTRITYIYELQRNSVATGIKSQAIVFGLFWPLVIVGLLIFGFCRYFNRVVFKVPEHIRIRQEAIALERREQLDRALASKIERLSEKSAPNPFGSMYDDYCPVPNCRCSTRKEYVDVQGPI